MNRRKFFSFAAAAFAGAIARSLGKGLTAAEIREAERNLALDNLALNQYPMWIYENGRLREIPTMLKN